MIYLLRNSYKKKYLQLPKHPSCQSDVIDSSNTEDGGIFAQIRKHSDHLGKKMNEFDMEFCRELREIGNQIAHSIDESSYYSEEM